LLKKDNEILKNRKFNKFKKLRVVATSKRFLNLNNQKKATKIDNFQKFLDYKL